MFDKALEELSVSLGEGYFIEYIGKIKKNGIEKEAVSIFVNKNDECKLVAYLDEVQEAINNGNLQNFTDYLKEILIGQKCDIEKELHLSINNPFIILRNRERENLKDYIYKEFNDLVVILCLELKPNYFTRLTCIAAEYLKLSEEDINKLFEKAIEVASEDAVLYNMEDVIVNMKFQKDIKNELNPCDIKQGGFLTVLTNRKKQEGAVVLYTKKYLKELADKFQSNLFILPSSVHECLILCDNGSIKVAELKSMVEQINVEYVSEEDFLSNNVYYYNRETGVVGVA